MSARLDLDENEREELAQLLAGLPAGTGRPESLNALLHEWSAFVTAVERGYDDSIYEYTNDLSARDRLARLAAGAGPSLRPKLESAFAEDDRRFTAATEGAARPLGASPEGAPPWWRNRVPRRRTGELAEDLEALGHLG